ncbi:MAG: hypothetical protein KJ626_13990 [Verrucomicrobia bacterium]|nr:hypothetical protein [Verrucomicrobiota bacterium]
MNSRPFRMLRVILVAYVAMVLCTLLVSDRIVFQPTWLAAREDIGGLILERAFISALRVQTAIPLFER